MNKAEHYLAVLAELQAAQDHAAHSLARLAEKAHGLGSDQAGWHGLAAELSSYRLALIAAKAHCLQLEALLAEGVLRSHAAAIGDTPYLQ